MLLETGLLAIFLGPWQFLPRPSRETPPPRAALWLLRLLLFKLMFLSGSVKLLSGDPTWRNLTALAFHYETQPLPSWIASMTTFAQNLVPSLRTRHPSASYLPVRLAVSSTVCGNLLC